MVAKDHLSYVKALRNYYNGLINFHSFELSLEVNWDFWFKFYSEISPKCTVTVHPYTKGTIDNQITQTIKILRELEPLVHHYGINLCLENLNVLNGSPRLNINNIYRVLDEVLYVDLTLDIGHVYFDGLELTEKHITSKIKNIHLHHTDGKLDHLKVESKDYAYLKKDLVKISKKAKQVPIVFEVALCYLDSSGLKERIKEYGQMVQAFHKYAYKRKEF